MARVKLSEEQLAEILRESSLISQGQLDRAKEKQQRTGYGMRQILLPQIPWARIRRMLANGARAPAWTNCAYRSASVKAPARSACAT